MGVELSDDPAPVYSRHLLSPTAGICGCASFSSPISLPFEGIVWLFQDKKRFTAIPVLIVWVEGILICYSVNWNLYLFCTCFAMSILWCYQVSTLYNIKLKVLFLVSTYPSELQIERSWLIFVQENVACRIVSPYINNKIPLSWNSSEY